MPTTMPPATMPPAVVPSAVVSGVGVMAVGEVAAVRRSAVAIIGTRITLILTKDGPPPAALSVPTHADVLFFLVSSWIHSDTNHGTESARQQVVSAFLAWSGRVQSEAAMIVLMHFGHKTHPDSPLRLLTMSVHNRETCR